MAEDKTRHRREELLQKLDLSLRGLKEVPINIDEQILQNLQDLRLHNNKLRSFPMGFFSKLPNLITLHLDHNKLRRLPPDFIKLKQLRRLYLNHNHFSTIPYEICKLPALRRLYLMDNDLEEIPRHIALLSTLRSLQLSGNRIKEVPLELGFLTKLELLVDFKLTVQSATQDDRSILEFLAEHIRANCIDKQFTLDELSRELEELVKANSLSYRLRRASLSQHRSVSAEAVASIMESRPNPSPRRENRARTVVDSPPTSRGASPRASFSNPSMDRHVRRVHSLNTDPNPIREDPLNTSTESAQSKEDTPTLRRTLSMLSPSFIKNNTLINSPSASPPNTPPQVHRGSPTGRERLTKMLSAGLRPRSASKPNQVNQFEEHLPRRGSAPVPMIDSQSDKNDDPFLTVSKAFEGILNDSVGFQSFHEFLVSEYAVENLLLWRDLQAIRQTPPEERREAIAVLFNKYISEGAEMEVDMPAKISKRVKQIVESPRDIPCDWEIFDLLESHVFDVMKADSYLRYKQSPYYKDGKPCVPAEPPRSRSSTKSSSSGSENIVRPGPISVV